jgi:hypothetical protein
MPHDVYRGDREAIAAARAVEVNIAVADARQRRRGTWRRIGMYSAVGTVILALVIACAIGVLLLCLFFQCLDVFRVG